MGRAYDLSRKRRAVPGARAAPAATTAVATALLSGACAAFGGSAGAAGTPSSPGDSAGEPAGAAVHEDTTARPANGSLDERMLAGDWEGVVALYAADSTLHADAEATYRAALASAMSGHPAHDPRRAARLFRRLLSEHPDTSRGLEAELFLDLLSREQELRATVGRLDRELQQLKAIDLGQEPPEDRP